MEFDFFSDNLNFDLNHTAVNGSLLFFSVNEKSKIAVAVLGSLVGIAVIAVIVLLIIRRWRMKPMTYQSETGLIENPEQPDNNSFPVNSATFNRSNDQNSHEVQDMVTYTGLTRNDHQRF